MLIKKKTCSQQSKNPLGDKNSSVVYTVFRANAKKYVFVGETEIKWEARKGEHNDKVRLTLAVQ